jgi:glucose-6-phosphate-specific signal transduction histidine kinase
VAAYYVVCESLTNVAKYAPAATVTVRVACEERRLVVEVADDGVGGADPSPASTIYGGGQNGIGSDGTIVEGGLGAQSEQAFENLRTVLAESRASPEDVARRWLAPAQRVAERRRFGRVP